MPDASFNANDPDSVEGSIDIRHHIMSGSQVEILDLQGSYGLQVECFCVPVNLTAYYMVLCFAPALYCFLVILVLATLCVDLSSLCLCRLPVRHKGAGES